jgi:hypothetical protein
MKLIQLHTVIMIVLDLMNIMVEKNVVAKEHTKRLNFELLLLKNC